MESALELLYMKNHTIVIVADSRVFEAPCLRSGNGGRFGYLQSIGCYKHDANLIRKQKVKILTCRAFAYLYNFGAETHLGYEHFCLFQLTLLVRLLQLSLAVQLSGKSDKYCDHIACHALTNSPWW